MKHLMIAGAFVLAFAQGASAQLDVPVELQQTYAENTGMALAAAQACPKYELDGLEMETVGTILVVPGEALVSVYRSFLKKGFVSFTTSFEDHGLEAACGAAWNALGDDGLGFLKTTET